MTPSSCDCSTAGLPAAAVKNCRRCRPSSLDRFWQSISTMPSSGCSCGSVLRGMPFANLKVPAGTLSAEQKQTLITKVTDLYADTFGERARATTMVLVEEVLDGGWGISGQVLTLAMLREGAEPLTNQ
jgi:4-oxalocrotonate tautomerase